MICNNCGCPIFKDEIMCPDCLGSKFTDFKEVIKMERISKDEYYLNIALAVSKRSTCIKRHYGCVIVKDDIIIATGYNGSPRGCSNCCDVGECKRKDAKRYSDYELCESVHAEQNALIATERSKTIGATIYLACEEYVRNENDERLIYNAEDKTPIPCSICERMLKNAGIVKVVNRGGFKVWE